MYYRFTTLHAQLNHVIFEEWMQITVLGEGLENFHKPPNINCRGLQERLIVKIALAMHDVVEIYVKSRQW
jgi:hypothetical protein